jgi:hypothetical protein
LLCSISLNDNLIFVLFIAHCQKTVRCVIRRPSPHSI